MLTVERLREVLQYDPETGLLLWKVRCSNRLQIGDVAGTVGTNGLRKFMLDGYWVTAGRAVWAIVNGEWPTKKLSHRNGNNGDDRIENIVESRQMATIPLTQARLRELLHYNPDTGVFTRRVSTSGNARAGDIPSYRNALGYMMIHIDGRLYMGHRLAWLYQTGAWPIGRIDHRDGDPRNNKFMNLRDATPSVNSQNQRKPHRTNTSGFLGVSQRRNRWRAQISVNNVSRFIGSFDTPEAAHIAYVEAKRQLHEGNML